MIRVVTFLVLVGLLALGVVWLADRPGEVAIVWLGWRIETSLMVLTAAIAAIALFTVLSWSFLRTLFRMPDLMAMVLRNRRGVRGYLAISNGLVAIGAGDLAAARKYANEAERIAPGEPLVLLLTAQAAQLAGDRATAEHAFGVMASRPETKLLGLRGLFVEAQRREDPSAASAYAEEAAKTAPRLAWAGNAAFEYRCARGDWPAALAALDRNVKSGLVSKAEYRRQRAVLLTARALAEDTGRDRARAFALEAVKLAPAFVPAAALAGRLLAEAGELRKASRLLEKAWRANPHPDLAEVYANLRFGDSARDRLARVRLLAQKEPLHIESALALARAALDAHEFAAARSALAPLLTQPSQRVAMLMAEIEEFEHGDEGRAREWMARAVHAASDPAWTADGFVSERWLPVSPVTGRLDAFEWKVPLAELGVDRSALDEDKPPLIEVARPMRRAEDAAPAAVPLPGPAADTAGTLAPEAAPIGREGVSRRKRAGPPRRVEAVVPLAHIPDDPGPEREREAEPTPEPAIEGWRRFRLLFK